MHQTVLGGPRSLSCFRIVEVLYLGYTLVCLLCTVLLPTIVVYNVVLCFIRYFVNYKKIFAKKEKKKE